MGKITFLKNLHFFDIFSGSEKWCSVFQIFKILGLPASRSIFSEMKFDFEKKQILSFKAMSNYVKSRFLAVLVEK